MIVTTLIGLHHFLAQFQVFRGRLADRYPLWGYRRTPYIIGSALVSSLLLLALPALASAIISVGVASAIMPDYPPASMQTRYNLTLLVVLGTTLLGVLGIERRITPMETNL